MKPVTLQLRPPRPNRPTYGIEELAMVPVFKTREDFEAFTGTQAPPFNPDKPVKRWYCTHHPDGTPVKDADFIQFQTYDTKPETPMLYSFKLSGVDMLAVNIPGKYNYPPAMVEESGAFYMLNGEKQYINPEGLATLEDAERIGRELLAAGWPVSSDSITVLSQVGMFIIGYEPFEKRRLYQIRVGANTHNVGALMRDQNGDGVGAPGYWTKPGSGLIDWIPAPVQERVSTAGVTPIPMRGLEAGEMWQRLPLGLQILNTLNLDGAAELNEKNMADNVAAIRRDVDKILAFFSIS